MEQNQPKADKGDVHAHNTTFNELDEKFQWKEGDDEEKIYDEEMEMMSKLRERIPQLKEMKDKLLAFFLCSRRHNMEEIEEVLNHYLSNRKKYNPEGKISSLEDVEPFLKMQSHILMPNTLDNYSRPVIYMRIGKFRPKELDPVNVYHFVEWLIHFMLSNYPLKILRNGAMMIIDPSHLSLSNLDVSAKGRGMAQILTGASPMRIRSVMVVHAGIIFKTALTLMKLIMPKKIMERIRTCDDKDLQDLVPAKSLGKEYGGQAEIKVEIMRANFEKIGLPASFHA